MRKYVDPYETESAKDFKCDSCNWAGKGSECVFDSETEMITAVRCPECDRKLGIFGSIVYLDDDPELIAYWNLRTEDRKRAIEQLRIESEKLEVKFSSKTNEILVMAVDGKEVYEYAAGFEGWSQILDLAQLLREAFPKLKIHVHLQQLSGLLWGDEMFAKSKLSNGLEELGMTYQWTD